MRVAFLTNGELYLLEGDADPKPVVSHFISQAEQREAKSQSINAWKSEAQAWGTNLAPGLAQFENAAVQMRRTSFSNVARDQGGNVAYSIAMPGAGGLFRFDTESETERRLMHRNDFYPQGLAARNTDGLLAFSIPAQDGSSNIMLGERDGLHHRKVTVGDSRDEAPSWHCEDGNDYIYFHSCGVGRSQEGYTMGFGPASICRLAIEGGDVEVVLESEKHDYLQPRVDSRGHVYAICRPYEALGANKADAFTILQDIVFFPYRLARTAFYFANFMSMMFSGKPLADSSITPQNPSQAERMVLWGRIVDTQTALRKSARSGEKTMAPSNWQLVRHTEKGTLETLCDGVLCFDVSAEGRVVFSNGMGVFELADGKRTKIADSKGVTQIAVLS